MISIDDLRLFLAVARERNFAAAAQRVGVPTSTLSRRVAALEASVGARLLQRSSRRVGLTDEGLRLVERAGPVLDELVSLVDQAVDCDAEPAGRLRVTAPVLVGSQRLAPALFAFAAAHPKVDLELNLTNAVVPLVEQGYDLAFRMGPVRDRELIARRLWPSLQAFAAAPALLRELGGGASLSVAALERAPGIYTVKSGWRLLRRDGSIEQVVAKRRVLVNNARVAIDAAVAGLGVVCAPVDALAAYGPGLAQFTIVGRRPEPRDVFAVYPSRTLVPARVRAALAWVIARALARALGGAGKGASRVLSRRSRAPASPVIGNARRRRRPALSGPGRRAGSGRPPRPSAAAGR